MIATIVFLASLLFVASATNDKYHSNSSMACSYQGTCSVNGYTGACVSVSAGCCSGTVTSGLCPGSSDIRCCTQAPCSTPSGGGSCMQTSMCSSQGGQSIPGYCTGPSDIQCCVKSPCSTPSGSGNCVQTSTCSAQGGTSIPGYCPGAADNQCCVHTPCSTPSGSGTCMQTALCASQGGASVAGYCPGASDIQCCIAGGGGSTEYGVDISTSVTSSAASCFKSSGLSFIIPRGYCSTGEIDSKVCGSLTAAANAGIKTRDVYLFPCPTCSKSASTQMGELLNYLNANCKSQWSGRVWLDIEGTQYWLGSTSANQNWYKQLKDSCAQHGVRCGVYSSASQWSALFGSSSFSYGSELPLWYAHYDNNPTFSDFSKFGGWSSPHAKQYYGDASMCGMGVDKNYAPNGF